MATKTDLLHEWVRLTGEPLAEARHRFRALSESGLLPTRAEPIGVEHLSRVILAWLASPTHKDAPELVQKFSSFYCGAFTIETEDTPLSEMSLLEAVTAAIRSQSFVKLEVNQTSQSAELMTRSGWCLDEDGSVIKSGTNTDYYFTDPTALPLPKTTFPVTVCKSVYHDFITRLAQLLTATEERTIARSEMTKAAGAPPPNGLQPQFNQAAEPVAVNSDELTHTHEDRQQPSRGLFSPQPTGKTDRHVHHDSDRPCAA